METPAATSPTTATTSRTTTTTTTMRTSTSADAATLAEPWLLASLLTLGVLALAAKFCARGVRAPARELLTFAACFAGEVVYEQWLLAEFPAPLLLAWVRSGTSALATAAAVGTAGAAQWSAADPALTRAAWAALVALGAVWGAAESLAALAPPSTVAAVEGSAGLALCVLVRLALGARSKQPAPDWVATALGVPLCVLGSALALPFDGNAYAIASGLLRCAVFSLAEVWMAAACARRRRGTTLVMTVAGSACFVTVGVTFCAAELPALLGKRLFHPLEFAALAVPSMLLSFGASSSALEFVRLSSAAGLVACVSVVNATAVAFLAIAPAVRAPLAAAVLGTAFGVLGGVAVARRERGTTAIQIHVRALDSSASSSAATKSGGGRANKPVWPDDGDDDDGDGARESDLGTDAEWSLAGSAGGRGGRRTGGGASAAAVPPPSPSPPPADADSLFAALGSAAFSSSAPEIDETAWLLRTDEDGDHEAVPVVL